jgi:hypothetical protein
VDERDEQAEPIAVKPGTRLRCPTCGAEAVVTKAEGPELTCCGGRLVSGGAGGSGR